MISDELSELVARLTDPRCELPAAVQTRARWLLLDTLGCAIAGGRSPTVRSWLDRHHLRDDPYGTAAESSADTATAMALTLGACWDEACEGHAGAHGRPGLAALGAIWPSVLDMTLGEFLRAAVVGYEVGARMGAALRIGPGMHVDANWPSLAAAAAAACAAGLDPERILAAVRIAACQLPVSLYRPVETGDTARNTYLGHAALLGRMAAESSAAGVTAPRDAIERYAQVAYGRTTVAVPSLAHEFRIMSGYFKEYAAVRHVHYAARAASELRVDIAADRIGSLDLWTYPEALRYCGIRTPVTPLQAQFSLSFGVAAMLRWGRLDPAVYRSPDFEDPLLRSLEKRVVLHEEAGSGEQRVARLRLIGGDGRSHETSVSAVLGDAAMPWSEQDLAGKFLTYCSGSLSQRRAEALVEHILRAPLSDNVFPTG
jgi:2-methylcitrate dehydratase PrpD